MSSDDSGFDKEAEREKLREKYEQDDGDRENTRRMSELLLQGATMTGKHCGECGDPIFRYDGQEFCPTCQREVNAGQADAESAPETRETDDAVDADQAVEASAEPDADEASDEPRVEVNGVRVADRHADTSDVRQPPSQAGQSPDGETASGSRRHSHERVSDSVNHESPTRGRRAASNDRPASDRTAETGDLGEARAALVRKLTDLAHSAERTDDVARARDLLAATREAAEALDALDQANR